MSKTQKYAWLSLAASGLIYLFFQMRMLDGWRVAEHSAGALVGTYLTVVIMAIIAEALIAGLVFASDRRAGVDRDERDHAIDARAEANAGLFLAAALNIIVIHALAVQAFTGHGFAAAGEALILETPAQIFFILFSVLFASHWVKLVSALYLYSK